MINQQRVKTLLGAISTSRRFRSALIFADRVKDIAFGLGSIVLINRAMEKIPNEELLQKAALAGSILTLPEPKNFSEEKHRHEGMIFMIILVAHARQEPLSSGKILRLASTSPAGARGALIRELQALKAISHEQE